jgi:hypothetical protein
MTDASSLNNSSARYNALRECVRSGDTVAVHASGAYRRALDLARMGPHGHVGIIRRVTIDDVERVFVVEENPGGGRYRPLSHYRAARMDVFSPPHGVDGLRASAAAVQLLDGLAQYDWREIRQLGVLGIRRAMARLIGKRLPELGHDAVSDECRGVICSALVTEAYVRAGWTPPGPCAWPAALAQQLGAPRIAYEGAV